MNVAVVATESTVIISNLTLYNTDVVQYFKQLPEEERPRAAVRAFEIGVFCLERMQMGHALDFVRLEVERLIKSAGDAISNVPQLIEQKLGGNAGPLAPVHTAVTGAQNAIQQKLNDVSDLFSQHLDPANAEATLGKALSDLRNLVNPERSDSVQKRIEAAISSISKADGELLKAVSTEVEKATKPLQTIIETLKTAVVGEEAIKEALSATTQKGFEFEEELKPILRNWAASVGAELEHVGPQNFPGDFVLRLKDTAIGPSGLTIAMEARDRQDGWGRVRIVEHMNTALKQWDGNYGIYVNKTPAGLAQEIGEWSELTCDSGSIIACTYEHLRTALRFALVDYKFRELQQSRREIDITSIEGKLSQFRISLNHLTQIKSQVNAIRQPLTQIESEADDMRTEINSVLQEIEDAIRR